MAAHLQLTFSKMKTSDGDGGCIITPHTCPCSPEQASAATCITPMGGNECKLATCKPDYICDCKGFETCEITHCAQYEAVRRSDKGSKPTFACKQKRKIGMCVKCVGLRNAPETLSFAMEGARTSRVNSTLLGISAAKVLQGMVTYKVGLVDAMNALDGFVDVVKKSDRSVFDKGVEDVITAYKNAYAEATQCYTSSTKTFKTAMRVSEVKRKADAMQEEILKQMEDLHGLKEEISDSGSECKPCMKATKEIENLKKQYGLLIREAGEWAQMARTHKLSTRNFLGRAIAQHKIAKLAYNRSLEHYKNVVAGLAAATGK